MLMYYTTGTGRHSNANVLHYRGQVGIVTLMYYTTGIVTLIYYTIQGQVGIVALIYYTIQGQVGIVTLMYYTTGTGRHSNANVLHYRYSNANILHYTGTGRHSNANILHYMGQVGIVTLTLEEGIVMLNSSKTCLQF